MHISILVNDKHNNNTQKIHKHNFYILIIFTVLFVIPHNWVNQMPADALAPCDARPAAMISTMVIWYVLPLFTES